MVADAVAAHPFCGVLDLAARGGTGSPARERRTEVGKAGAQPGGQEVADADERLGVQRGDEPVRGLQGGLSGGRVASEQVVDPCLGGIGPGADGALVERPAAEQRR